MPKRSVQIDWERIARANTHELRISVLEVLALDGGRTLSPKDLETELQVPLPRVSYHVCELQKQGLVTLVDEQPRRAAIEHFYELSGAVA